MSYKLALTSVLLALTLTSCSTLDLAKTALGMDDNVPSIDVKAQFGKTNTINEAIINSDTGDKIDVDTIDTFDKSDRRTGNNNDNSTTNIPVWVFVLSLIAALFVDPIDEWNRIRTKSVKDTYGNLN